MDAYPCRVTAAPKPTNAFGCQGLPATSSANNFTFLLVANGMRFAFGWYILDGLFLGSSEQGFVIFMLGLPALFFTLIAGVWADRYDRKALLNISQAGKAVVMAAVAFAIATDTANLACPRQRLAFGRRLRLDRSALRCDRR